MYGDTTLQRLAIIALILTLSAIFAAHAAAETAVHVDASEFESGSTFDVEIEIDDVEYLDSGMFELFFDPRVVRVTDVNAGNIEGTEVPIDEWTYVQDLLTKCVIKAVFNLPGSSGVSGSGHLATINFEVTGEAGNCSFLNISNEAMSDGLLNNGELWDVDGEEISAEWANDIVCIGEPPSFDDFSDSADSAPDAPKAHVTVFVKNRDDDSLDIELHIDGNYKKNKKVSKDKKEEYSSYPLDEGVHTFMILWYDSDTDKWYEKVEKHNIIGVTTRTLMTDEHTEDEDKLSARVYIENRDDDDLDVYLYIDEVYKKYKKIPSNGSIGDYGEYEFEEDEDALHSFRIEWFDPGTDVTYEKIVRSYITTEEAVTLYVDKHAEEDIILLEDMSTPVSTISKPSSTSTRTVKEPTPAPTKTHITEMHTNPKLTQDSSEGGAMEQHISATCTLLAFVAVLFVLMQIRRI